MKMEMKDSGIPWVGAIPKDWVTYNIGSCTSEVSCANGINGETNALQFKMGEIIRKSEGNSKYNPETLEAYNIVDKGVVMINGLNLSFDLISQRVGFVKERGVITSTYIAIRPNKNLYPYYFTYLMKAYDNCKAFHAMGRGLRQTLSYGELRKHPIFVPPIHIQQQIANFLDDKCANLDQLIALQQKMIDELKAYKQSVITEAVTKGLDKSVPMKDSGIDNIGSVPNNWKVSKLKNFVIIKNGKEVLAINDENCNLNIPVYGSGGLFDFTYTELCKGPSVLLGRKGTINHPIWIDEDISFWIVDTAFYTIPKEICNLRYFYYNTLILNYDKYIYGTALPSMTQTILNNIYLPLPDVIEQGLIVNFLDKKCSQIDTLISIKQQKINELKEYKKSMIYEYITGKKQVPN